MSRTLVIRRVEAPQPGAEAEPRPSRVERAGRSATVRVYMRERAMDEVWSSVGRCPACSRISGWAAGERGGALVGRYAVSELGRRFIVITEALPALAAQSSRAHIEIRVEDWQAIYRRMSELPGRRLLGWYHSQPGLGVRMSHTDRETQRTLFRVDWQVGLVVDPFTRAYRFYQGPRAYRARWLAFVSEDDREQPGLPSPTVTEIMATRVEQEPLDHQETT